MQVSFFKGKGITKKEAAALLPEPLHGSLAHRMGGESPLSLVAGLILTMMAMKFSYADSISAGPG